ncbi:hypothetical protein AB0I28_17565 [Phytomonospora sp. NPDC050363]|uniref:hypothetical protein n=1 Tax=Phytomonospora sp. NPDC050363 TaxID=3155642 RepID=UPI0033F6552D
MKTTSVPRRGLAALLTIAATALAAIAPPVAANAADPAVSSVLTAPNFRFKLSNTPASLISGLDAALPNVTMQAVVDSGNRTGVACSAPAQHRVASFCWNSGDAGTGEWMPQGITTSADALGAGTYEDRRVLMASWYSTASTGLDKGVRISVVDLSNPSAPAYRHILLVAPATIGGQPSFNPVRVHAGGLAWYGNLLYVVDTYNGLRVFDLNHLWQVTTGDESKIGRQADGTYHAYNYAYVLPQTAAYAHSTEGGYAKLRFSAVSLDRTSTPDSLVIAEYASPGTGTRLARVPIDYTDRLLVTGSDGYARANEAHLVNFTSMQGATAINGTFHVSTSDGTGNAGDRIKWKPPAGAVDIATDTLPIGPEDVSYDGPRDMLWSLSEYAGKRYVWASRASSL